MSLYIHQENQKLIWESICKLPIFQEFGILGPGKRETWFRSIIQQFYEGHQSKSLTLDELRQLNRETVAYMLNELKIIVKKKEPTYYDKFSSPFGDMTLVQSEQPITSFSSMPPENKHVTRDAILEKKQVELNVQFAARQQEYGSMLNTSPANKIDFRFDARDDVPMENIDMLMEEKMKQRKYDLENIGFDPPPQHTETVGPPNQTTGTSSSALFSHSPADFQLDVIDLGKTISHPGNISQNAPARSNRFPYKDIAESPPKSVRWNESITSNTVKHRPPNYSQSVDNASIFKDFMEDIRDTMNDMRNELISLKRNSGQLDSHNSPVSNQNPLVNTIVSRMKRKTQPVPHNTFQLQDVTNEF